MNPHITAIMDADVKLELTAKEFNIVRKYLEDVLHGPVQEYVIIDSNQYRGFWRSLKGGFEYRHTLTWNEALRLYAYMEYCLDKNRVGDFVTTMSAIRNFPVYGVSRKRQQQIEEASHE